MGPSASLRSDAFTVCHAASHAMPGRRVAPRSKDIFASAMFVAPSTPRRERSVVCTVSYYTQAGMWQIRAAGRGRVSAHSAPVAKRLKPSEREEKHDEAA